MPHPPVALSIAGSDCSAGAGIQADLKTFQHFEVHGLTAVTCVVSETSRTVMAIETIPAATVASQVSLMIDSFPVAAIKTGMLHSAEVIEAVARCLSRSPSIPLVVDPVMVASSGARLMERSAVTAYNERLFPLASLLTPNIPEAEVLLGSEIANWQDMTSAAVELSGRHQCAVLLKGGHLGGNECHDVLCDAGAVHHFSEPRISVAESHGTGCTLSAAIGAGLARGMSTVQAVRAAKSYLSDCLRHAYRFPDTDAPGIVSLNQGTHQFPHAGKLLESREQT